MTALKHIWLAKILTVALLFSASAWAQTTALYETMYTVPGSQTKYFIRISDNDGGDVVMRSEMGGAWETMFTGTITQIFQPEGTRVHSGSPPARVEISEAIKGQNKYIEFASATKFHILYQGYGTLYSWPRPPGVIESKAWQINAQYNNDWFSSLSIKTNLGEHTAVVRKSDRKHVIVSPIYNRLGDITVEGGIWNSTNFSRKINLNKFEQEATVELNPKIDAARERLSLAAKELKTSKVEVTDAEGKASDAWTVVKSFVTDLTEQVADYHQPDQDTRTRIEQIFRNLVKREVGSAKILGPAGTGKTHLIKKMIAEIMAGNGPSVLNKTIFLQIDPASLTAGTRYVGSTDTKINAMIALSKKFNIVWVIDEAHVLRGAGTHSQNSNDIFQMLKPGLTEGFIRIVAMSTDHEWSNAFAGDPALNQRFGEVKLTEPTGDTLRVALKGFAQKHKFPEMDAAVLELVIRLSTEFNAEGAQPRKATLLIEEVFADQALKGELKAPTIDEIKHAAQRLYNLHPDHFDRAKMQARLRNMPKALSETVIGQQPAKDAIVDSFGMAMAGVEDKNKPKGRKIFAGPRGQGKTEIVKAAGAAMETPVVRIVMTTYTNAGQTEELKRTIAQALRKNANCILFFDEIEKAHPSIQKDLLDVLDNGRFSVTEQTNGRNGVTLELNVRNAYVYMATNAGAGYIDSLADRSEYKLAEMREAMHRDGLNDLVLDRMDGVVPFFYLTKEEYKKVVIAQVRHILAVYKQNNPDVKLTLENIRGFIDQTVNETFRPKMSNREALTALSGELRVKIARAANAANDPTDVRVLLGGARNPIFTCPMLF